MTYLKSVQFVDRLDEAFVLRLAVDDTYILADIFWRESAIGYVKLTVRNSEATLGDILIRECPITFQTPILWLVHRLRIRSFRARGIGTKALEIVLATARDRGIRRVTGTMDSADATRLARWYRSLGFDVCEKTNTITKIL
ncbi:MAG: GNAT family N-acetyltransferase [Aeromicrobium sp.]|nr:GNAT family N-acetyltransferase [Burkholderiales bacterium]